ncbi:hypothetical protein [Polaromonas sp. CF318]|uniref:hypothetical protein n=1 Tax=Polaromonas sp. CF318 TaxID=1144318 RepID=UPI00056B429C|nr:hypothetical protein [Polaromonas sp. CF318]
MQIFIFQILACFALALSAPAKAQSLSAPFTGTWSIDLRTPSERKEKVECGTAAFKLLQTGNRIIGSHSMATARCGRLNDGGEGSVKGTVVGSTAVLTVTSARNGQIVLGSAKIVGGSLHWQVSEEIKAGEQEGDSGLILQSGVLRRERR